MKLGVYLGPGTGGVGRLGIFSSWFGRPPDRALEFFANDTWPSLESDAAWACQSWAKTGLGMTFSVPLTVNGTPLADVAAGLHDSSFVACGNALVANGLGSSVIRLGWEFNGSWMPWAAGADPKSYVAAYRRVVSLLRSISKGFTFDWCTAWGLNSVAPDAVYPGDDVVDIIGMDVYNRYYVPALADPVARWANVLSASYGLNWLVSFVKTHAKLISIPEWGTGEWTVAEGGTGGGDDPTFITNMAAFMNANSAVYSNYWDINAGSYNASVSDGEHPLAGAALKAAFAGPTLAAPGPILWIGEGQPPTGTSLSINFSPPYGGGAPDHFLIEYQTGEWLPYGSVKTVGTIPLVGLKQNTAYKVRVTAVNAAGSGTPSAPLPLATLMR